MPAKRVLVVDDYEPWRRFVCTTLGKRPELNVIKEVSDGAEAVRVAQELKPDLVLLDIGLPRLNGIEAARQIREFSPDSKILFVSEQRSWDIVEAALRSGGNGYVYKSDANGELLPALDAVLQGQQFVSASLIEQHRTRSNDGDKAELTRRRDVLIPFPLQNSMMVRQHEVGFYSDDELLLDHVAGFIGSALRNGSAAIIAATESHLDSLVTRLQPDGLSLEAAIQQGRYIAFNITDALSTVMINGTLDPDRFLRLWGDVIMKAKGAAQEQRHVAIFGEGVHLLWAQGNAEAAIQAEKLGNQLVKTYDVDLLCTYFLAGVEAGMEDHIFQRICAEHSAVYGRELSC